MVYEAFGLVLNVVEGKGQEEDDALCGGDDGDNGGDGVSGESSGIGTLQHPSSRDLL